MPNNCSRPASRARPDRLAQTVLPARPATQALLARPDRPAPTPDPASPAPKDRQARPDSPASRDRLESPEHRHLLSHLFPDPPDHPVF